MTDERPQWERALPELDPSALHGPAGKWARQAPTYSEASVVGTLAVSIVGFGIASGATCFWTAGAVRHRCNEDVLLVGPTGVGRKGEALAFGLAPLLRADEGFPARIMGGFGSGEAVVEAVRDPRVKLDDEGNEEVVDPGATDKRLLVKEPEFGTVLTVAARESSILSTILRAAWDGEPIQNRVKGRALVATNARIGVAAGITGEELLRKMTEDERSNGFANRFLHVAVYRSGVVPKPQPIPVDVLAKHATRFALALAYARHLGDVRIEFDEEAGELWDHLYTAELSVPRYGLAGSVCARAEAHTRRIAMLYALLDRCDVIKVVHLVAALALWRYCEASARLVYGDATGNPVADRALTAIRDADADGVTRNDLRDAFSRHVAASALNAALGELIDAGLVVERTVPTGGRPVTFYFPCAKSAESAER